MTESTNGRNVLLTTLLFQLLYSITTTTMGPVCTLEMKPPVWPAGNTGARVPARVLLLLVRITSNALKVFVFKISLKHPFALKNALIIFFFFAVLCAYFDNL